MSSESALLIIAYDRAQSEPLAEIARAMGFSEAKITHGTAEAVQTLESRAKAPDFLLIDIGAHTTDILPELDRLAESCEEGVNVVLIGGINDIGFYRELKNRGVLEYFPRPAQAAELSACFHAVKQTRHTGAGHVIACMAAASGDGSSTLAVNTAYCLAAEFRQPTVLVDMDYQFGLIAKSLDLSAPFGTRELFEHPDRGLDDLLMQKMLVKYEERLSIISAPNELRLMPTINTEVIEDMLSILRSKYKYVVVDLPHVWTDWTATVLKNADQHMLVGQLWLRSLTHATRMLTAWQAAGIDRSKVYLTINRSGAKFKEAISAEEFERICNQSIHAHLNNDIKAVVNAENQGKTLYETASGSLLQQQFKQIAHELVVRFEGESGPAATGKKGLMGIFDKKASA